MQLAHFQQSLLNLCKGPFLISFPTEEAQPSNFGGYHLLSTLDRLRVQFGDHLQNNEVTL